MFLVFPLNDRPNWRKPPVFTLLLIVLNFIVFFGPQRADEKREESAGRYYQRSALPALEMPLYLRVLQSRSDRESRDMAPAVEAMIEAKAYTYVLPVMEQDAAFMADLKRRWEMEPAASTWRTQRQQYEKLRGERFTARWMSVPADRNWETAISAMFMHGSTGHLIGNMIFLLAFGYTVELTLGAVRFLLFYLLAGIGGDVLHLATHWNSHMGSLGASGAISGLMAMYAALYGRRSIRFFYQLFFYFDYVRAPAWILIPAWLANEVIQFVVFKDSNIGYMAHAGGLITGTALIWFYKRNHAGAALPLSATAVPVVDTFPGELARARKLVEQLKLDEARTAYAGLCLQRPGDLALLTTYAGLARLAPSSEAFHLSAALAFAFNAVAEDEIRFVHETFVRYLSDAQPRPRLNDTQLLRLGMMFVRSGYLADAIRIEAMLARLASTAVGLASLRLALVDNLIKHGRRSEAATFALALQTLVPGSSEARLATDLLGA